MSSFRYKRDGLPLGLIKIHDVILKVTVDYFEKGKDIRKGIKQARKAVKKALRVAKKKKINPGLKIGLAREALEEVRKELEYTRKSIGATYSNLDDALDRIQQERLEKPIALIEKAHELFRDKQIEKGIQMLQKSQKEMEQKVLVKTRTVLFGGTSNRVTDLKEEIEKYRRNKRQKKKENR